MDQKKFINKYFFTMYVFIINTNNKRKYDY